MYRGRTMPRRARLAPNDPWRSSQQLTSLASDNQCNRLECSCPATRRVGFALFNFEHKPTIALLPVCGPCCEEMLALMTP